VAGCPRPRHLSAGLRARHRLRLRRHPDRDCPRAHVRAVRGASRLRLRHHRHRHRHRLVHAHRATSHLGRRRTRLIPRHLANCQRSSTTPKGLRRRPANPDRAARAHVTRIAHLPNSTCHKHCVPFPSRIWAATRRTLKKRQAQKPRVQTHKGLARLFATRSAPKPDPIQKHNPQARGIAITQTEATTSQADAATFPSDLTGRAFLQGTRHFTLCSRTMAPRKSYHAAGISLQPHSMNCVPVQSFRSQSGCGCINCCYNPISRVSSRPQSTV